MPLNKALFMHDKWLEQLGIKDSKFAVVTWSDWDCRVMLESECRFKKILKPTYFNQYVCDCDTIPTHICNVCNGLAL